MQFKPTTCTILITLIATTFARGATPEYTRTQDVIYGRKFGTALTMDVFRPKSGANGAAIVWVVSGAWFSSHEHISQKFGGGGYTMFAVVHGSQPRFTIVDAVADLNRAVRFIRFHAKDYGINPDRIGITGGSAGGHLSLMQAMKPADPDEKSPDPVERTSARVQAVACLFPPTDFLNYGEPGKLAWTTLDWLPAPFGFEKTEQVKKTNPFSLHFVKVDAEEQKAIAKEVSPIYWVTENAPPTLIISGDADKTVPVEQSQRLIEKLKQMKVPAKLEIRKGQGHGWVDTKPDVALMLEWFNQHLATKKGDDKKAAKSK
jgi:acetyl esterase/lipase